MNVAIVELSLLLSTWNRKVAGIVVLMRPSRSSVPRLPSCVWLSSHSIVFFFVLCLPVLVVCIFSIQCLVYGLSLPSCVFWSVFFLRFDALCCVRTTHVLVDHGCISICLYWQPTNIFWTVLPHGFVPRLDSRGP